MTHTEKTVQNVLVRHLMKMRYNMIVPNCKLYGYEADMLSLSKSGMISEFEIKISTSDFRADAKKVKKHRLLASNRAQRKTKRGSKTLKPNYFYYIAPEGVIPEDEVPRYAGFIEIIPGIGPKVIKKASRLHGIKADDKQKAYLGRSLMYRYWKSRMNDKNLGRDLL